MEASTASMKASIASVEASIASIEASMEAWKLTSTSTKKQIVRQTQYLRETFYRHTLECLHYRLVQKKNEKKCCFPTEMPDHYYC